MKTVKDVLLKNKKIILRAGMNIPLDEEDNILDDTRLLASAKTINFILKKQPKMLLVITHIGRPQGEYLEKLSTKQLIEPLEKILKRRIIFVKNLEHLEAIMRADIFDGEAVYLLENIRFWKSEESNDEEFGKKLGKFFQVYVNDAFSTSHRKHASFVQIPKFVKNVVAGLLLEEEYNNLSLVRDKPEAPAVAIIGGAKIATKLPVIKNLLNKYDKILIGGMVANEVLDKKLSFNDKVILPVDFSPLKDKDKRLDIGPLTIVSFREVIQRAKTIIWNGPLGKFEEEESAKGTRNIIKFIELNTESFSLVGGGETLEAINKFGHQDKYDYVSKSGGAMLEFLAGKKLPGLKIFEE